MRRERALRVAGVAAGGAAAAVLPFAMECLGAWVWRSPPGSVEMAAAHLTFAAGLGLALAGALSAPPEVARRPRGAYRLVRHPRAAGLLLALWSVPQMTLAQLGLALGATVLASVALLRREARAEVEMGAGYGRYRDRVPMLVPGFGGRAPRVLP